MKTVLILVLGIFASSVSFAKLTNPNLRICNQLGSSYGAQYYQLNVSTPELEDSIPFCKFGNAVMGTPTLMAWVWSKQKTEALQAYKKSSSGSCEDNDAVTSSGLDVDSGRTYSICTFSDQSWILLDTLNSGANDPDNAALSKVFGL